AIRTAVIFSSPDEKSRSVLVTSTSPHEGKTLVASNLAGALAQAGRGGGGAADAGDRRRHASPAHARSVRVRAGTRALQRSRRRRRSQHRDSNDVDAASG